MLGNPFFSVHMLICVVFGVFRHQLPVNCLRRRDQRITNPRRPRANLLVARIIRSNISVASLRPIHRPELQASKERVWVFRVHVFIRIEAARIAVCVGFCSSDRLQESRSMKSGMIHCASYLTVMGTEGAKVSERGRGTAHIREKGIVISWIDVVNVHRLVIVNCGAIIVVHRELRWWTIEVRLRVIRGRSGEGKKSTRRKICVQMRISDRRA